MQIGNTKYELNNIYNEDCLQAIKQIPDKYFELAIIDPPYGISINNNIGRRKNDKKSNYKKVNWDNETPKKEYFNELFRVSKNQIIWGGNYFTLPPTKSFIVWRKPQISENISFSMVEYAWTSFDITSKEWIGISNEIDRIHPTQKPVALYEWQLNKYAKKGDKILDTHLGSASSIIACKKLGFEYLGFELDEDYFKSASERIAKFESQENLFDILNEQKQELEQENLFNLKGETL